MILTKAGVTLEPSTDQVQSLSLSPHQGQEMGESPWIQHNKSAACGGRDLADLKGVFLLLLLLFGFSKGVDPGRREALPCVTCTEFPPLSEWSRWRQSCRVNSQHSGWKSKRTEQ